MFNIEKTGMTKKEKILWLVLNIVVLVINGVVQAATEGGLAVPAWILQAVAPIATTIRIFLKGWTQPDEKKAKEKKEDKK